MDERILESLDRIENRLDDLAVLSAKQQVRIDRLETEMAPVSSHIRNVQGAGIMFKFLLYLGGAVATIYTAYRNWRG